MYRKLIALRHPHSISIKERSVPVMSMPGISRIFREPEAPALPTHDLSRGTRPILDIRMTETFIKRYIHEPHIKAMGRLICRAIFEERLTRASLQWFLYKGSLLPHLKDHFWSKPGRLCERVHALFPGLPLGPDGWIDPGYTFMCSPEYADLISLMDQEKIVFPDMFMSKNELMENKELNNAHSIEAQLSRAFEEEGVEFILSDCRQMAAAVIESNNSDKNSRINLFELFSSESEWQHGDRTLHIYRGHTSPIRHFTVFLPLDTMDMRSVSASLESMIIPGPQGTFTDTGGHIGRVVFALNGITEKYLEICTPKNAGFEHRSSSFLRGQGDMYELLELFSVIDRKFPLSFARNVLELL